jgi:hypothetical protein
MVELGLDYSSLSDQSIEYSRAPRLFSTLNKNSSINESKPFDNKISKFNILKIISHRIECVY